MRFERTRTLVFWLVLVGVIEVDPAVAIDAGGIGVNGAQLDRREAHAVGAAGLPADHAGGDVAGDEDDAADQRPGENGHRDAPWWLRRRRSRSGYDRRRQVLPATPPLQIPARCR